MCQLHRPGQIEETCYDDTVMPHHLLGSLRVREYPGPPIPDYYTCTSGRGAVYEARPQGDSACLVIQ